MKIKRIISSVLALSAVFALASCGNTDNGGNGSNSNRPNVGDNGTINVMLLETGIGTDFLNDVADDFYNETGITVKVNSDSLIDEDLKNSMTLEDGVDDDIYMSGLTYNWIDWVNADTIEDLTDLATRNTRTVRRSTVKLLPRYAISAKSATTDSLFSSLTARRALCTIRTCSTICTKKASRKAMFSRRNGISS